MFGIGGFELFIILVFGFLIFGPDKLPEIAKTVGKGIARFRSAQQEMNETLGNEKIFDPNNPDEPFKDPIEVLDRIAQKQEEKKNEQAKSAQAKNAQAAGNASAVTGSSSVSGAPVADSAEAATQAEESGDAPKQESFTERKARYERERAARKAAEREVAESSQVDAESAQATDGGGDA